MSHVVIKFSSPTERMSYGADLLFRVCLGLEVRWNEPNDVDHSSDSYTICYGPNSISCPIHSISFSQDEQAQSAGVKWVEYSGYKFPCEVLGLKDLQFDPLAAVVFCACRWEEIVSNEKDEHDRYIGSNSSAHKHGMLSSPLLEILASLLAKELGVEDIPSEKDYEFIPTIDIDIAYAYRGRGVLHSIGAGLRDLLLLRFQNLTKRFQVVVRGETDPYDTYKWLIDIHKGNNLPSRCFVLRAEKKSPYDVGLDPREVDVLISSLEENWTVCWHPSYASTKKDSLIFNREKNEFPSPTDVVRTHFLRGNTEIWSKLVEQGITHDYSMGYSDLPGFRAGMSRPFPAFDLHLNEPMPLIIHPVAVMDSTLKSYMKLTPDEAIQVVSEISDSVKKVGGTMVTLWHNTSVSDFGIWKGWQRVYVDVLNRCLPCSHE
jgi:hypothetical protein